MHEQMSNVSNITEDDTSDYSSTVLMTVRAIGASICYIVCLLILVVNTLILVCFYQNRRTAWFSHSKNIISVVMMDWVVGFTGLYMLSVSAVKHVNLYVCVFSQTLCISSQVGSLLNVFRLCVFRFVSSRTRLVMKESSTKSIIIQTVLVNLASIIVCTLPVFIWVTDETNLNRCSWSRIYKDHVISVNQFMLYVTAIPAFATSALYISLCIYLKRSVALVAPLPTTTTISSIEIKADTDGSHLLDTAVSYRATDPIPSVSNQIGLNSISPDKTTKSTLLSSTVSICTKKQYLEIPSTCSTMREKRIRLGRQTPMTSSSSTIESAQQNRLTNVFKTVGAILICMNISILPYVVVLAVNIHFNAGVISGDLFFFVSAMLLVNSALDPIIYIVRIKHLKVAFKRMIRRQCCA